VSDQLHVMAALHPWGWGTPLVIALDSRPVFTLWGAWIAQSVIESRYGLDGPEIESRWGRDFPHLS